MTEAGTDHATPDPTPDVGRTLLDFLSYLRAAVIHKVEDLDEAAARWSPVTSGTSLLALTKHLTVVERYWVVHRFAGQDLDLPPQSWLELNADDTVASVVADYRAAAADSDAILAGVSIDTPTARSRSHRTLGWILVHLVEETARHAGHADIIRELHDGATGR